jgi:anti-sigma B factor antagonist
LELGIDVSRRGDATVLSLTGDIDIHTAPELRDRLAQLHSDGAADVVVDLSAVNFLDSSALGAFVAAHHELAEKGGSLKLAAPRSHVLKVFQITRLAEVIPLFESVDEACT